MKLIARNREIKELGRVYESKRSEFVIVYGRRRIGKTFLVNEVFQDRFTFTYVGARKQPQRVQLQRFARTGVQRFPILSCPQQLGGGL